VAAGIDIRLARAGRPGVFVPIPPLASTTSPAGQC
jgi:hypothetical protein